MDRSGWSPGPAEAEAESRARLVFDRNPLPIVLLRSAELSVLDANRAYLQLLGLRRAQVIGRSLGELEAISDHADLGVEALECATDAAAVRHDLSIQRRGEPRRELQGTFTHAELAGTACRIGVYVDVTVQRQLEARLREAVQGLLQSAAQFSSAVVDQLGSLQNAADDAPARPLEQLTPRERQVLGRIGAGQSNLRIAEAMGLTPQTVRNYVTRIYRKIAVENRSEAVVWARERGMVEE